MENQKKRIPFGRILIYARYLLPAASALVLLLTAFFDIIRIDSFTARYSTSLWKLYFNVFSVAKKHFATSTGGQVDEMFTLLMIGSVVGLILLLVACALVALGTVTALRAYRAEKTGEECRLMKMIHRVAFPNRLCLFLSQLLLILPTLYANFYTAVNEYYALTGVTEVLQIRLNLPMVLQIVLAALTLVVAVVSPRFEREAELDMYTFYYPEEVKPKDADALDGEAPDEDGADDLDEEDE